MRRAAHVNAPESKATQRDLPHGAHISGRIQSQRPRRALASSSPQKAKSMFFFFFFFFFLQIAVTLGLDTKGDSNVTGNWRFIACIDIYNLRATSTADPIRRARARRKARLLGVFVVEKNCCTNAR
jgi:hypothetical protein